MFCVPGYIGLSGCVWQTFAQFVEKQALNNENFIKKFQDNTTHHQQIDKKIGMVLEKLGFMETHFIDVREELTKKFNAKYQEIDESLAATKLELSEYTDS